MDVYFATNRDLTGNSEEPFGIRFHQDGPQYFRVGVASVSKTGDTGGDDDYRVDSVTIADENLSPDEGGAQVLGSDEIFGKLKELLKAEDTF